MLLSVIVAWQLSGCHPAEPTLNASAASAAASGTPASADDNAADLNDKSAGVSLSPQDIDKLGLKTSALAEVFHILEVEGFGMALSHEAVATAVAELMTARATVQQSHSALVRQKRLSGTPGALSADMVEAAVRQVAVDDAALTLAERRLSAIVGLNPPWPHAGTSDQQVQLLASGRLRMIRATFSIGVFADSSPQTLRVSPLGADRPRATWIATPVWAAPADNTVPGRSFFALLKTDRVSEGERLRVWGNDGDAEQGVIVPAAALVMSEGKYWCYIEREAGSFVRRRIDIDKPVPSGYFVTGAIAAGDKVVTVAAGQLLARERNLGAEPN